MRTSLLRPGPRPRWEALFSRFLCILGEPFRIQRGISTIRNFSVSATIDISRPILKIYSEHGVGGGAEKRPPGSV
jgi:hypothetical protein